MKELKRVTSKEIMEAVGIRNQKTLTRWYSEHELIPSPEIDTHPDGRGKMAFWPHWVLRRCIRIRQLLKAGHSLDEIRDLLGTDWEAEAKRYARSYRFTEASRGLERDAATQNFAEAVVRSLPSGVLRGSHRKADQIEEFLLSRETIEYVLSLMDDGYNPVLVLDGEDLHIVPDFVVGQMLAKAAVTGDTWWVMSLQRAAYEAFKTVVEDLAAAPRVKPVARIVEQEDQGVVEQEIQIVGPFDFETVGRRIRKKSK